MDVNENSSFWENSQKKIGGGEVGRGGGSGRVGEGGQGGCERRIEVFVKIQKKKLGSRGGGGVGSGGRGGGSGWGSVRVDVNEELKFLGKFTKKIWGGDREGGGQVGGRVGGGSGWM